jgi:hypothetical protein
VFFSRQRNPTASELFSRVKAVLLLSPDKNPAMVVLIPRHNTTTAPVLFSRHKTSTAAVVLTTNSHRITFCCNVTKLQWL